MRSYLVALAAVVMSCAPFCHSPTPHDRIEELAKAFADAGQFQGAIRGEVSGETSANRAFGLADVAGNVANTTETQFHIASITKAFTAVLTLQQVQKGRLELDAAIAPYFPGLRPEIGERVTLRHLLSHTSGISRDYTEALHGEGPFKATDLVDALNSAELLFEPGTRWDYSNTAYYMLLLILERATGQTYSELLNQQIVRIAGLKNTTMGPGRNVAIGYESSDMITLEPLPMERADQNVLGAGGMFSTTRDLSRFMRAVGDGRLLDPKLRDLMLTAVENGDGTDGMGWAMFPIPAGGRIINASGTGSGYMADMAYIEDDPSTNMVWLSNDKRMGRRGFLALANGAESLMVGNNVPIEAPKTPAYTFFRTLLDEGEHAAIAYLGTLDWSDAPVANAAATQATGAPDGGVGETQLAWAPATADAGTEWLSLSWKQKVRARAVHVQFTQIPGVLTALDCGAGFDAITTFPVQKSESDVGAFIEIYSFEDPQEIDKITLQMDTAKVQGWPQIDAVGLIDDRGEVHWADGALSSSSAFDAGDVSLHDLPTPQILDKLMRRLRENDRLAEAERVRAVMRHMTP